MFARRERTEPDVAPEPDGGSAPLDAVLPPASIISVRGRSLLALVLTPEPPFDGWFAALDRRVREAPELFASRPVIVDLGKALAPGPEAALQTLDALAARGLKVIAADGVDPAQLDGSRWAGLPTNLRGATSSREASAASPRAEAPAADAQKPPQCLYVDGPVRSGQSVVFKTGDVTIVGSVASGAEIVAGGSINIFGALRGRAIAGVQSGESARILCLSLEAELIAVNGIYRTAEHWGPDLHGLSAQVRSEQGLLRLTPISKTLNG